jgi:hypothetical protein
VAGVGGGRPRAKNPWSVDASEHWRLPWLAGEFHCKERLPNPKSRAKTILLAYASGKVAQSGG